MRSILWATYMYIMYMFKIKLNRIKLNWSGINIVGNIYNARRACPHQSFATPLNRSIWTFRRLILTFYTKTEAKSGVAARFVLGRGSRISVTFGFGLFLSRFLRVV